MEWQRWEMRLCIVRLCLLHDLMRVWADDAIQCFFPCAEKERSSDDAPDEHHVVPACLPAMMMMNHQISGFEIIIPKSFVVM